MIALGDVVTRLRAGGSGSVGVSGGASGLPRAPRVDEPQPSGGRDGEHSKDRGAWCGSFQFGELHSPTKMERLRAYWIGQHSAAAQRNSGFPVSYPPTSQPQYHHPYRHQQHRSGAIGAADLMQEDRKSDVAADRSFSHRMNDQYRDSPQDPDLPHSEGEDEVGGVEEEKTGFPGISMYQERQEMIDFIQQYAHRYNGCSPRLSADPSQPGPSQPGPSQPLTYPRDPHPRYPGHPQDSRYPQDFHQRYPEDDPRGGRSPRFPGGDGVLQQDRRPHEQDAEQAMSSTYGASAQESYEAQRRRFFQYCLENSGNPAAGRYPVEYPLRSIPPPPHPASAEASLGQDMNPRRPHRHSDRDGSADDSAQRMEMAVEGPMSRSQDDSAMGSSERGARRADGSDASISSPSRPDPLPRRDMGEGYRERDRMPSTSSGHPGSSSSSSSSSSREQGTAFSPPPPFPASTAPSSTSPSSSHQSRDGESSGAFPPFPALLPGGAQVKQEPSSYLSPHTSPTKAREDVVPVPGPSTSGGSSTLTKIPLDPFSFPPHRGGGFPGGDFAPFMDMAAGPSTSAGGTMGVAPPPPPPQGLPVLPGPVAGREARPQNASLYFCHLCSYSGETKSEFDEHMTIHFEFNCQFCDYTSRTEGRLKRHIKDFHSADSQTRTVPGRPKVFKCKQCCFQSTDKYEFWRHARVHIKEDKMLECPKCPFVTEYKHHLEYHLRNHFGHKPYKCGKCNYSCVNKSMLNSHMKSHTNVYQYRCANCTYATKYCHSLKMHLKKYRHKPATVLNSDGSLPQGIDAEISGLSLMAKRGPPRGPRGQPKNTDEGAGGFIPGFFPIPPSPQAGGPGPSSLSQPPPPNYNSLLNGGMLGGHYWAPPPPPLLPMSRALMPPGMEGFQGSSTGEPRPGCSGWLKCKRCCFGTESLEELREHEAAVHGENHDMQTDPPPSEFSEEQAHGMQSRRMSAPPASHHSPPDLMADPCPRRNTFPTGTSPFKSRSEMMNRFNPGMWGRRLPAEPAFHETDSMFMAAGGSRDGEVPEDPSRSQEGGDILRQMTLKFGGGTSSAMSHMSVPAAAVSLAASIAAQATQEAAHEAEMGALDLSNKISSSLSLEDASSSSPPTSSQQDPSQPSTSDGKKRSLNDDTAQSVDEIFNVEDIQPRKRSRKGKAYKLDTIYLRRLEQHQQQEEQQRRAALSPAEGDSREQHHSPEGAPADSPPEAVAHAPAPDVEQSGETNQVVQPQSATDPMNQSMADPLNHSVAGSEDDAECFRQLQENIQLLNNDIPEENVQEPPTNIQELGTDAPEENAQKPPTNIQMPNHDIPEENAQELSANIQLLNNDIPEANARKASTSQSSDPETSDSATEEAGSSGQGQGSPPPLIQADSSEETQSDTEKEKEMMLKAIIKGRSEAAPPSVRRGAELALKLLKDPSSGLDPQLRNHPALSEVTSPQPSLATSAEPCPVPMTSGRMSSAMSSSSSGSTFPPRPMIPPALLATAATSAATQSLHLPHMPPHSLHGAMGLPRGMHSGRDAMSMMDRALGARRTSPESAYPERHSTYAQTQSAGFPPSQGPRMGMYNPAPAPVNNVHPFECPFCDLAFKDHRMYTIHMSMHTDLANPFQCRECGQQCQDRFEFTTHMISHPHREK
ncbi:uncharacterized protein LOC143276873 [Babylonia areolata]|uniref:uncharacterized protein LOC143276873 n=1 Tax=Babylonia areolata TaxID=304850 RepID=UPI003FD30D42